MRQGGDDRIGRGAGIAERHDDRDAADDGRDDGQGPDGAVRREVLAVQQAEVLGNLASLPME